LSNQERKTGGLKMFKKDNLETPPDKVNTLIGKDTLLKGTLESKGSLRIDGRMEGQIDNKGDFFVGESGVVAADLKARNVTIAGRFDGSIEAGGRLELKRTAVAKGTFKASTLHVEDGAVLDGSMEMKTGEGATKLQNEKYIIRDEVKPQT
jgi:cytoskeletal protein CcmA (bactofilin family)